MARLLLSLILVASIFSCKHNATDQRKVERSSKVVIEIPKVLDKNYQVLKLRDLGVVHEGERLKGEFYLKSLSDTTIFVNQIKGTCGCMEITADFKSIHSGELVKVGYMIDSNLKEGEEYFDLIFDTSLGLFMIEQKAIVRE